MILETSSFRHADKRSVDIMKVHIERNNLRYDTVTMLTLFTFTFAKRRIHGLLIEHKHNLDSCCIVRAQANQEDAVQITVRNNSMKYLRCAWVNLI